MVLLFSRLQIIERRVKEKYTCSFRALKGLMKNKLYKEVQYLQWNCSGYFKPKQKVKRRSRSNQLVNLIPFYVINQYTQTFQ